MDTRKSSYGYEEFGMVSIGSYGYWGIVMDING